MKKFFGKKPKGDLTADEVRDTLENAGIPTKASSSRTSKFSQYSEYAAHLNARGNGATPGPGSNPYAVSSMGGATGGNPYAGTSQGYGQPSQPSPYAQPQQSYGGSGGYQAPPRQAPQQQAPQQSYGTGRTSPAPSYKTTASPYASAETDYNQRYGGKLAPTATNDTFENSRNQLFGDAVNQPSQQASGNANNNSTDYTHTPDRAALFGAAVGGGSSSVAGTGSRPIKPQPKEQPQPPSNDDELLMTSSELDQRNSSVSGYNQGRYTNGNDYGNGSYGNNYGEERDELDSEDEDVEAVKTQMKYIKKESVNATRDALMSAARAEESGRNALGMLGAQGERIANTERSLALASTQNKIAEEKARELKTLNRSMFAVHVGNPFNSKRRLQEREDQIKNDRRMDQLNREDRRQAAYASQQRVVAGLNAPSLAHSATAQKYAQQRNFKERAKYQFEADSEDEDLENEIDRGLDALTGASARLNKLALTANEEIKNQNARLGIIADEADSLDVGVHLNTNRLMNIK